VKQLPTAVIKPLLLACDETINLLLGGPLEITMFFTIEKHFVLPAWFPFFKKVNYILSSPDEISSLEDIDAYKLCFYLDMVGRFMYYNGTNHDAKFVVSVNYFFEKYHDVIGERDSEKLFWCAFPEISLRQANGKPFDPTMRVV
jgi:hypothetical protein